jgi:hypothetical protein
VWHSWASWRSRWRFTPDPSSMRRKERGPDERGRSDCTVGRARRCIGRSTRPCGR